MTLQFLVYVNGHNPDVKTELGRMVHDLLSPDPNSMYNNKIAATVREYKENGDGYFLADYNERTWGIEQMLKSDCNFPWSGVK